MRRLGFILIALLMVAPAQATEAGWALLREGGHVVILRHALSNGTIDPPNFDIEKCNTQRNLSERGKQQAKKIGALFATRSAPVERVLSSRYCRSLETARLAFDDRVMEEFEPLDSASAESEKELVLTQIRDFSGSGNMVLVTQIDNINALIDANAREGEAVIVRAEGEGLHVLGRIVFN